MTVFAAGNVRDRRGKPVSHPSGAKFGELEAVHVDTASDEPAFATVKIGMTGRHRLVFVPLAGGTVRPDALRAQFDNEFLDDGPTIDTDAELAADAEPGVFSHYGIPAGNAGVRRLTRR
jgi:hypothetical protein